MVRRLRLAFLFCYVYMLLIFVFTWHPLKKKISGEQVPRVLLRCESLREVILIFSERKVVFVDGCWIKRPGKPRLDCPGDGDGLNLFLNNSRGGVLYC